MQKDTIMSDQQPFLLPSDLKANYEAYRDDIREAALRVLDSGWYIGGKEVDAFENAFAEFAGATHCVGVASGTDALHLAMRACDIGVGNIVITVSHTAVATVAAIELAGATPVLIDVDPELFTMSPSKLRRACEALQSAGTPATAVIPVHIYGQPADMHAIIDIAKEFGLTVIEDCSQAHGAKIDGRTTGTFGAVGTFSFYPTKNLGALGDGGAVITDDPDLAARARLLKEYGWKERYVSALVGMNTRLDPLQAAMLAVKLVHLAAENVARRAVADRYDAAFADSALVLPVRATNTEHVFHQYVIQHPDRNDLRQFLHDRNIGSLIHYPVPVHKQPAYESRIALPAGPLAVTEALAERILSLPIHAQLTEEQLDRVISAVNEWLKSH